MTSDRDLAADMWNGGRPLGELRDAVARSGDDADARLELAVALAHEGYVAKEDGDLERSHAFFTEASTHQRWLVEHAPDAAWHVAQHAVLDDQLAEICADLGDRAGALAHIEASLAARRGKAIAQAPEEFLVRGLAVGLLGAGHLYLGLGETARADACYDECLALYRREAARAKDDRARLFQLQVTLFTIALARYQRGAFARAAEELREHARVVRQRVDAGDLDVGSGDIAASLAYLGEALRASGDAEGARSAYDEVCALAAECEGEARHSLAAPLAEVGAGYLSLGDIPRARAVLADALARARAATRVEQEALFADLHLALLLVDAARAAESAGALDEARAHYREARGLGEQFDALMAPGRAAANARRRTRPQGGLVVRLSDPGIETLTARCREALARLGDAS